MPMPMIMIQIMMADGRKWPSSESETEFIQSGSSSSLLPIQPRPARASLSSEFDLHSLITSDE